MVLLIMTQDEFIWPIGSMLLPAGQLLQSQSPTNLPCCLFSLPCLLTTPMSFLHKRINYSSQITTSISFGFGEKAETQQKST